MADSAPMLTVEYHPSRPVELLDLTASLHALGWQYKDFIEESGYDPEGDVRLYIKELRSSSIIAELSNDSATSVLHSRPYTGHRGIRGECP
jgi:hypothetical protein